MEEHGPRGGPRGGGQRRRPGRAVPPRPAPRRPGRGHDPRRPPPVGHPVREAVAARILAGRPDDDSSCAGTTASSRHPSNAAWWPSGWASSPTRCPAATSRPWPTPTTWSTAWSRTARAWTPPRLLLASSPVQRSAGSTASSACRARARRSSAVACAATASSAFRRAAAARASTSSAVDEARRALLTAVRRARSAANSSRRAAATAAGSTTGPPPSAAPSSAAAEPARRAPLRPTTACHRRPRSPRPENCRPGSPPAPRPFDRPRRPAVAAPRELLPPPRRAPSTVPGRRLALRPLRLGALGLGDGPAGAPEVEAEAARVGGVDQAPGLQVGEGVRIGDHRPHRAAQRHGVEPLAMALGRPCRRVHDPALGRPQVGQRTRAGPRRRTGPRRPPSRRRPGRPRRPARRAGRRRGPRPVPGASAAP